MLFNALKKTIGVCLIGLGLGILLVLLLPIARMAIYNWYSNYNNWDYLACLLEKEVHIYDNSCEKSSKGFKRISKVNIWN